MNNMYQLIIDYRNEAILIPKTTVYALGSPSEVSFLYGRDTGIIAVACGGIVAPAPLSRRGRPSIRHGIIIAKNWDDDTRCYKVKCNTIALELFSKGIPDFETGTVYILHGDFMEENVIGFDLAGAKPAVVDLNGAPFFKSLK